MRDWRKRSTRTLQALPGLLKNISIKLGILVPLPAEAKETVQQEKVTFFGMRPNVSDAMEEREERRVVFRHPRPPHEDVQPVDYAPTGMAWHKGRLIASYSVQPIRLADIFRRPPRQIAKTLDEAIVVESDNAYSYGDWVHCFLGTILRAQPQDLPVVLPNWIAQKSYVQRDLDTAGVKWIAAEDWIHIRKATVLRKPNPLTYWGHEDVTAFQAAFPPALEDATPDSLLYLGRFDIKGETVTRAFPSAHVAQVVTAAGGHVVTQSELTVLTAKDHAHVAETVIGDHGSGLLNIMFWRPKTVIELVVDNWWVNNSLFVAKAMGVENFAVISVDGLEPDEIRDRIDQCLTYFGQTPLAER